MGYVDLPTFISFNLIGLPQVGNQSKYWEITVNLRIQFNCGKMRNRKSMKSALVSDSYCVRYPHAIPFLLLLLLLLLLHFHTQKLKICMLVRGFHIWITTCMPCFSEICLGNFAWFLCLKPDYSKIILKFPYGLLSNSSDRIICLW